MEVFYALGHPVGSSCTCATDLKHAAMHLHIESQNVAAQIGKNSTIDQSVPERLRVLRADVALVGARKAVYRMHRMMTKDDLMLGV